MPGVLSETVQQEIQKHILDAIRNRGAVDVSAVTQSLMEKFPHAEVQPADARNFVIQRSIAIGVPMKI